MINETIKNLLGEELVKQVEEALKGKGKEGKDIDLVIGNDGSYVPADKYDVEKGKSGTAEKALKAAAEALKEIGGSGDPQKLADDVAKAKSTLENLQGDYQTQIAKLQKTTALKLALANDAYDPEDIITRIDLDKIDLDENGEVKSDLGALIQPIRESKEYLFKPKEKKETEFSGAKPADPGTETKNYTQDEVSNMTMAEYRAYRDQTGGFPRN